MTVVGLGAWRCTEVHPFDIDTNNGDLTPKERERAIACARSWLRCNGKRGHAGLCWYGDHPSRTEWKPEPAIYFTTDPSRFT